MSFPSYISMETYKCVQAATEFLKIVASEAEYGRGLALNVILKLSLSVYLQGEKKIIAPDHGKQRGKSRV